MASLHASLLSKVLSAIALGGATAAVAAMGCGERPVGAEQRTQSECELETCAAELEAGEATRTACMAMPDGGCNACDHAATLDELEGQLAGDCGFVEARRIECGPTMSGDGASCCYTVAIEYDPSNCTEVTAGRPFLVAGHERNAPAARGSHDWARALAPSMEDLSPEERTVLAEAWTRDALAEHASVAAFARHVLELMSVGAPPDLVAAAQRAADEEVEHARLCFGLASAYAGAPVGPGPLELQGVGLSSSRIEIAVAVVKEGCIGETLAAAQAAFARDACRDPVVRAVLDRIAADESRHAALAWRTVAWLLRDGDAELRAAVRRTFDAALRADAPHTPAAGADLRARGRLGEPERRALTRETLALVVRPAAERLTGARDASSAAGLA